ncbi:hypothetical protein CDL15_Pgr016787 [Punica granatum]|uniref:ABC transmembrane type-1 domain-containing protein n=1 Tax=Punica granatum TaxID=22663 RepID=A0A218WYD7_PUNGR|nr:hypothetical protein CDL15_Pgr016787 [Punica granatum]
MAKDTIFRVSCILAVVFLSINSIACSSQDDDRKVYIVYMGSLPTETSEIYSPTSHHLSLLQDVVGDERSASVSIVRSYKRSFNGFAAKLTKQEAEKLAKKDGVLSVFPSQTYHVQTTKSWDYIGLPNTVKRNPTVEGNTIIGVIDSGVYPNSESFSDKGFGPPPSKWKGSCNGGTNFTCNNKLIGARYYVSTEDTAVDASGHGTHTASTAAGNAVEGASFFGLANGTARGAVPSSRIAIYRVCDSQDSCEGAGILAAFDDAIADGVDIITVSLGGQFPTPFDVDSIAIGSFHAMSNGILVTHSAGNSGPDRQTVASVAPWVLTVAANTIDRKFISKLELNDGTVLTGIAVNSFPSSLSNSALVFGDQVAKSCDEGSARLCFARCLDMQKVSGKILVCQSGDSSVATVAAIFNASGVILMQDFPDTAFVFPLPAVALDNTAFEKLMSYYNSTRNPQGRILKGETVPDSAAPVTASFSSRGPNAITPDIMKPDVSAPGVDILAAYPPDVPPSKGGGDDRRVKFNVISGTSMSCPHVAGAAAYVKTFHPDWSPSAIKSALMTTGQINPIKAADPGLVYEITKDDYVNLLCSLGINIRRIDGNSTCPKGAKNITEAELNYPSLIFKAPVSKPFKLALSRTVTNVGPPNSTYKAKAISASNVNITVVPEILSFKSIHEKKSFTVEISGSGFKSGTLLSEELDSADSLAGAFPNFKSKLQVQLGDGPSTGVTTFRLVKALISFAWKEILIMALRALIYTVASFVGPYLIEAFVQCLSRGSGSLSCSKWALRLCGSSCNDLREGPDPFMPVKTGPDKRRDINFVSIDAERVGDFVWYMHDPLMVLLQVTLALIILYKNLGLGAIASLVATILVMLANLPLASLQEKFQEGLMKSKDKRMKATLEILRNMKILKLQAWEMKFLSKIRELRGIEVGWLKKFVYTCALTSFVFWGAPTFVTVATFVACMLMGIPLESGKILSALATFRILQEPIYNLSLIPSQW